MFVVVLQFIIFMINCAFLSQNTKEDILNNKTEKTACQKGCSYLEEYKCFNEDCESWCQEKLNQGKKVNPECWIGIMSCEEINTICNSGK